MPGTPRVYLRLNVPYGDGTRTVTVVAHDTVEFFEAGERPSPLVEDRLLELMASALRKLGMPAEPRAVTVTRVGDDEVWCDVEVDAARDVVGVGHGGSERAG
jgi:hypothetical protein